MLSEHKRTVLRDKGCVFLEGKWMHKGRKYVISNVIVHILGDEDFEGSLDRYLDAEARNIKNVHFGKNIFAFGE